MLKALKSILKQTAIAFTLCALLSACGKRTPPIPPVERVLQKADLNAVQRGNRVRLTFLTPARNAGASSVLNIDRVDIFRLAEPLDSPLILTEEDFASRSTLIATIPITDADFGRKEMAYEDVLNFAGQKARLRYAARFANKSGQKAAYSNFLLIEPAAKIADAPDRVTLTLAQESVTVAWSPPAANIDASKPANILGYNVYRSAAGTERKLNSVPVTDSLFADRFFEFGAEYIYYVRTVSLGVDAQPVESLDSKSVRIVPVDNFAPAAPAALTIAAAPSQISIFFAANTESDVAGYRVYRSIDRNLPPASWTLLTDPPLTANTFQDQNVESGKTYFYYLTAIDRAGNVSQRSEIVGETVP